MSSFPRAAHESWRYSPAFDDRILTPIGRSLKKNTFYPLPEDIFKAFELPRGEVKVVIVGLSPYANTFQGLPNALGRAFGVSLRHYDDYPPSLKLIADVFAEVEDITPYFDSTLMLWQQQGVLLLNYALTAIRGEPRSHVKLWEPFIKALIEDLGSGQGIIFYLMGAEAKTLRRYVGIGNPTVESMHPAYWAREERTFEDQRFTDIARVYKEYYGTTLEYLLPF